MGGSPANGTPRIVVENPQSPNDPSELLEQSAEEEAHAQDDDRTPFLDNHHEQATRGWRHKFKGHSDRIRTFSRNKRNVIVGLLSILLVVLIVVAFMSWRLFDRERFSRGKNPQILVHAKHGAVATELDTCSNIGVKILQEGGNAVDAAIAAGICIGSINMFSAGIGGGGFMVVRHPNSTAKVFNFRETAPANSSKGMYDGNPLASLFGGLAVGVPGEIAGYGEASKMFGKLSWKRLFKESIDMMRDGTPVPPELANRIKKFGDFMLKDPDWQFLYPNGTLLRENDIFYRRNFSDTLKLIAEEGPQVFYNGSISKSIVKYVQSRGGIMTEADVANYTVSIEDPVHGWYHGREVITCGAPCSGPALIQALNILEGYDLGKKGQMVPDEVHLLIESMKYAAAARTELGDPFDKLADRPDRVAELMSKEFAARLRANISLTSTFPWQHYNPKYDFPRNHGTTHISVIDNDGMAVTLTSTVNLIWGSQLHDPTTGIILNDEMDDFSQVNNSNAFRLEPSPYNYIRPFKRPMSSSTPTIVLNPRTGEVELVLGASGGARILTSVLDAIVKHLDWKMDLLNMVEHPRLHHQLLPEVISMEEGYSRDVLRYLEDAGHVIEEYDKYRATAEIQAVRRIEKDGEIRLEAVSDSRKNGIAAGY